MANQEIDTRGHLRRWWSRASSTSATSRARATRQRCIGRRRVGDGRGLDRRDAGPRNRASDQGGWPGVIHRGGSGREARDRRARRPTPSSSFATVRGADELGRYGAARIDRGPVERAALLVRAQAVAYVAAHQCPELGAVGAHRLRPYSGVRGLADGAGAAAHRCALEPRPKPGPYRPVESEAAATNGHRPVLDRARPDPTG